MKEDGIASGNFVYQCSAFKTRATVLEGSMKEMIDDVMATVTDEQYFRELYNAEKLIEKPRCNAKSKFIDWIHANYPIGNGHMLVKRMEDTQTQEAFIKDAGLPDDVELI